MKKISIFLIFLFLVLLHFPGMADQSTARISMDYWAPYYHPAKAIILPGTQIEVVNPTSSTHTIRDDQCLMGKTCLFDTGAVPPKGKTLLPNLPPGEYAYHCELHPIMKGTIIVQASNILSQR